MEHTEYTDKDDQFIRSKYNKVYIPRIEDIKLSELNGFTYIKTIDAGRMQGHIIKDNKVEEYTMCLSHTDTVKVDVKANRPLGYTRFNIPDLEKLAQTFIKALQRNPRSNGLKIFRKNIKKFVEVPKFDITQNWHIRTYGHYIINIKTKEEIPLHLSKNYICKRIDMKISLFDTMLQTGGIVRDWCYKGQIIDGRTWEEYFAGAKPKKQIYDVINYLKFVKDDEEINYISLRETAYMLGTNDKKLAYVLRANKDEINGYKIIKGTTQVLRADLEN